MNSKLKVIIAIIFISIILGGGIFAVVYFARKRNDAKVVATIFPIYDICRNVMGTEEDLLLLEDSGADLHNFQPNTQEMAVISKSELFIYIGGESDAWVDNVIKSAKNPDLVSMCLMNEIEAIEETDEGLIDSGDEEHEDHDEEEEVEYDEHIWLSLKNMIKMTRAITKELIKVFPDKQEIMERNRDEYIEKLIQLDNKYEAIANSEKTLVIADRFPFIYLTTDYNLKYLAAFSGCSSEIKSSPETITKLIEKVNEEKLDYICILESSTTGLDRSVVDGCGRNIQVLVINSCQSITASQLTNTHYLDIMEDNLVNFKKALGYETI